MIIEILKSVHINGGAYFKGETYEVDSKTADMISKQMGKDSFKKGDKENVAPSRFSTPNPTKVEAKDETKAKAKATPKTETKDETVEA